jgi:hypothetical protein
VQLLAAQCTAAEVSQLQNFLLKQANPRPFQRYKVYFRFRKFDTVVESKSRRIEIWQQKHSPFQTNYVDHEIMMY